MKVCLQSVFSLSILGFCRNMADSASCSLCRYEGLSLSERKHNDSYFQASSHCSNYRRPVYTAPGFTTGFTPSL